MDAIKAIIQKIVTAGKHGPYAVATNDDLEGSITISLEPNIWKEKDWPERGNIVRLSSITQKRAGWRAKEGRFWNPSDEQFQQRAVIVKSNEHVKFLYPTSRQFPFDEVCEKIVRRAEEKNWNIPGLRFEFDEYGTGEHKFRYVSRIYGSDFQIYFCRVQGSLSGNLNDIAAVTTISIPKMEINVYSDESGPRLFVYVGKKWETDKNWFMGGIKIHSKMDKKPRLYLVYTGGCQKPSGSGMQFTYSGRRSPYLVNYDDLGREYSAEGKEPNYYGTAKVLNRFTAWLENNVLKLVCQAKDVENPSPFFIPETFVPWPEKIHLPLFTFGGQDDNSRIKQGKADKNKLEPQDRYGLLGAGRRLVPWDVSNDGTVPELAYDGFLWCGLGSVDQKTKIESLKIPGHSRWSDRDRFIVCIKPKSANNIFIADMSAREEYKAEWFNDHPGQKSLSHEAYREFLLISGRTIIPITDYKGDYKEPVVLINRDLSFDEVEVVSGPDNG